MTDTAVTAPDPAAEQLGGASGSVDGAVEEVVVLDYGGQYSQLIARRVRECGVFSELLPHDVPLEEIARRNPRGIILSGGPASVYAEGAPRLERGLLELGVPVMGICYGMQLLVHELGGRVEQADVGEFGRSDLHVVGAGRSAEGNAPRADLLDVPHGTPCSSRRPASRRWRPRARRRWRRWRTPRGVCTASSFTPRSCTRRTAGRS